MSTHRFTSAAAMLFLAAVVGACSRDKPPPPKPSAPVQVATAKLSDPPLPDELAEGTANAFGLPIPRDLRVTTRFTDEVTAEGHVATSALTAYVKKRVVPERETLGEGKSVFERATLKSSPDKVLQIEVVLAGDRARLFVRDVTSKPSAGVVKPTDPWSTPGFDPRDGKADPRRFQ